MKKKDLIKVIVSFLILVIGMILENGIINLETVFNVSVAVASNTILVIFVLAYIIIGGEVLKTAAVNILHGQIFDENFLMTIATIGAFLVGEYPEAVAVMLFYQIGEMFQSYAVNRSRRSISELMDIKPETANLKNDDGTIITKKPEDIKTGDIIIIKPGEKVPLDGIVISGSGDIDTSALTGESIPRFVEADSELISGSISLNSMLEMKVTKEYKESTVAKILELVENASSRKSRSEKFISKFARYYTPIVVILAIALALIPTLISGFSLEVFKVWGYRACSFLVISCPCALVISVPLSFFGGIGGASSHGVLVKGSNYMETLSKVSHIVCDKTGTLTEGNFKVTKIDSVNCSDMELLIAAAKAEKNSNHPIAKSLLNELKAYSEEEYTKVINAVNNAKITEFAGYGIKYEDQEDIIFAGNSKLMDKENIEYKSVDSVGSVVYVARNGNILGSIVIEDIIKEDTKEAIEKLKSMGIKLIMLTGDKKEIAKNVAEKIGIDEVYSELLPQDKVSKVNNLLENKEKTDAIVFVGDGINDAPVLAGADVGIAMGGLGSDAAIEAADIVIMDDKFTGVSKAVLIAKKTVRIVKENIVFALGVKIAILILAAFGIANMWMAVFADVGVAFIAILNALRAMKLKEIQ
ncbi:MAG: heavy metal translocating P-type ATPase [Lachnospiraceae bacterium]|nr:heavy metal translocating P-type ATPase [Lachnospiraceae bacterium]